MPAGPTRSAAPPGRTAAPHRGSPAPRAGGGALFAGLALIGALAFGQIQVEPKDTTRLHQAVRSEDLPLLIATNHLDLGAEAGTLVSWILKNPGLLTLDATHLAAVGNGPGPRPSLALSPVMARTLRRLNQWHGLAATEDNPISHDQLRAATLAPESILRIQTLFEEAIGRGVRIGRQWLTPEIGGEATIDTELRLAEVADPRWRTIQELAGLSNDARSLAALFESRPEEMAQIDSHALLRVAVARFRSGAPGSSEEVRRAVATVTRNAAPTYSLGPEAHLAVVTGRDWSGRYVGGWHTHAPKEMGGEWVESDGPSFEDMQNAVQFGQFLTLSFQPDGFDLYDAGALADAGRVDLSLLKVIRHRSDAWRRHFEGLRPRPR